MNILMLTNTFTPHVGGVARSVEQFAAEHRRQGHAVLVVAPSFDGAEVTPDVVRVPAIQNFNGTSFSVPLPVPGYLDAALDDFHPDIVHSNHPFLLGHTALRIAASRDIPVVFTHHTLYDKYTHYVVDDSSTLKRFVSDLAAGYCNLCDAVIAPSESIRRMLLDHGVERRIEVIPTGVVIERFSQGDGASCRQVHGIPSDAFIVGHVGRLAVEKNLRFLAHSVASFVAANKNAWFLVAGDGPCASTIEGAFRANDVADRLVMLGELPTEALPDVYHAMDVFAFASQSETQGMVLTEAMAAGAPVVAVDGPGVRDVVRSRENGVLLMQPSREVFAAALFWMQKRKPTEMRRLRTAARRTARQFSMVETTARTAELYQSVIAADSRQHHHDMWSVAGRRIAQEWRLWENMLESAGDAVLHSEIATV
ncbi:MAG: glycosyltransferase [Planctomycetota bacterium]